MDILNTYDYIIASLILSLLNILTIYIFDKLSKYERSKKDYFKIFFSSLLTLIVSLYLFKRYYFLGEIDTDIRKTKIPKVKGGLNLDHFGDNLTSNLDTGLPNF